MSSAVQNARIPARIFAVDQLSPRVVRLCIDAGATFNWAAGQHLSVSSAAEGGASGYYSIASAPDPSTPGVFELAAAVDSLPVGIEARVGVSVWLGAASGSFPLGRISQARAVGLIGMGTGVAPLRAAVQALLEKPAGPTLYLLHGARTEGDCLFHDEFQQAAGQGFVYLPVLSRPSEAWKGRRGRVQQHLDQLPPDAEFCACGSAEMVAQVRAVLAQRGVEPTRVYGEGY